MSTGRMQTFSLTKWYLDCVDAEGRTAIAYWSALAWRGLAITWHSLSLHETGTEALHVTSLASVAAPAISDAGITWHSAPLGCRFDCRPRQPGVGQRLLDTTEGSVDWRCETTAGEMAIVCDDRPAWRGLGYVERLEMSIPPWRLPIDRLRWGRWIAADGDRSVVWIDWRGTHPMRTVFVDGESQQAGLVCDGTIETDDAALAITDQQTLCSRSLSDTLGALGPTLAPMLPHSWMAMEDRKWLSRGTFRKTGHPDVSGWVIHEQVRWPS